MALKTNTKKARENVRNYILTGFTPYETENETEDFTSAARYILKTFYEEKIKHDKRRLSHYEYFKEWCQGLPSVIDTCYYYNRSAVKDVADILEETEEEAGKYTEQQAEELLTRLVYRELTKVVE
jgi:hypothetical protein